MNFSYHLALNGYSTTFRQNFLRCKWTSEFLNDYRFKILKETQKIHKMHGTKYMFPSKYLKREFGSCVTKLYQNQVQQTLQKRCLLIFTNLFVIFLSDILSKPYPNLKLQNIEIVKILKLSSTFFASFLNTFKSILKKLNVKDDFFSFGYFSRSFQRFNLT